MVIEVTGLSLKNGLFITIGIVWQIGIIFAYLIINKISRSSQFALVSCLLFASSATGMFYGSYAIARSLANNPEVILADEPTGNLDTKTGMIVMDFLKKLHEEEKKTIVMVTHDEDLAKKADRIIYLKDGMVVKKLKG